MSLWWLQLSRLRTLLMESGLCPKRLIYIALISTFLITLTIDVQAQEKQKRVLNAISAETQTIKIDGLLNETLWQLGDVADHFVQQEPHVGAAALAHSFVRMAYDETHLYIAAILRDPKPEKIHADERQEDGRFDRSDAFAVLIDTYHDHQNGFFFESNPLSAMADALVSQEGSAINRDWDGSWQVAAQRTARGWSVEFKIPFETLRFRPGDGQTWGIQFRRRVPHLKEVSFWSPLSIEQNFFEISRSGHLEGIKVPNKKKPFSFKPYVRGAYQKDKTEANGPSDTDFDGGLDLRYQFRSNLALDLTWNTDFAETEVDRFRTNLTRFPLFFLKSASFF
ncbi:MAG: carbohydrate binding family 9 domain-containing protein [Nitrospirota bacterium]|nr:carbohydrate binding family 9 domain-containing protein [Nitrospirota bacterium]